MQLTRKSQSSQGLTLIVVMVLTVAVIVVLASITMLINHESYITARTQAWHQCIPVAEAGIEEALSLMRTDGTYWGWTNRLTTNGWSSLSSGITKRTRTVDGSNYFIASIDISSGFPKIDSTGYVFFPAAKNGGTYLSRKVELSTSGSKTMMTMGLICSNAIALSGATLIDSYDSSTNTGSTGGMYDPSKRRDNATVATASTNANAIQADGSSCIFGFLKLGKGGGTYMSGTSRGGSTSYVGGDYGTWPPSVEASRLSTNFIFNYPDVIPLSTPSDGLPATFASLPTKTLGGTTYNVSDGANLGSYNSYQFPSLSIIGSGNRPYLINGVVTNVVAGSFTTTANGYMVINTNSTYALYAGSVTLDGGPPWINGAANSMTIGPNCNVLMYVTGDFTITASGRLYIDPTSTLTIYAGGNVDLSGAGLINAAAAKNLSLYGLPTCRKINIAASANFIGSIYAPAADVSISGASPYYGSCICRSAVFAGSGKFHFDEALNKSTSSSKGYYIKAWHEVAP